MRAEQQLRARGEADERVAQVAAHDGVGMADFIAVGIGIWVEGRGRRVLVDWLGARFGRWGLGGCRLELGDAGRQIGWRMPSEGKGKNQTTK